HRVDTGDRRTMDDVGGTVRELAHRVCIEHIGLVQREVRVVTEIGGREGVAVKVVERDDLVLLDDPAPERRRDETGAAGDEDALSLQSHDGESSLSPCRETSAPGSMQPQAPTRSSWTAYGRSCSGGRPSPR